VARIIVVGGTARGVVLADGTEARADVVISAADGRTTLFGMLGEEYLDDGVSASYTPERVSNQPIQVNIGVARDFSNQSHTISYLLSEPVEVAGRKHERMTVGTHSFGPSMAPPGKASLAVFWSSDYRFWQELASDPVRYRQEKQKAADVVIRIMESHYPGFAAQVEVTDVSTPISRLRHTGNWMGAMQGWRADPDMPRALLSERACNELGSVKGFYMAGQWAEAWGGITTAAQSGRKVIQLILSKEGRKLATTV
jgi:phytoene dehydrogenase-like protein